MWSEIRTLFWLQWKLTRAMFRGRRTSDQLRIVTLLIRLFTFVFSFPMFALMGAGLAVVLILLSPGAAYEVVMWVNVFLFFIWLLLPASYNSQLVERFEMSRLFLHPISFRGIVVGSTLMSLLTMTGFWTVPILLGEVVGLAWHQPLALPLILLGALSTFALLVLTGRVMDDFFDLVAGDRRLRALALVLLTLPFTLCWVGPYLVQNVTENFSALPEFARVPFLEELAQEMEKLGQANDLSGFRDGFSRVLEVLGASRLLTWLPPGWTTAGMGLAARGDWGPALLFTAFSTAFVALVLRLHAAVTRRLMQGVALSLGAQRVRSPRRFLHLPGPPALWALFRKDWIYLWRSPLPRQLLFAALIVVLAMVFSMRPIAQSDLPPTVHEALPLIAAAFAITMVGMASNMALAANYFGAVDREGFATLVALPQDRRYTLLAANLVLLVFTGVQVVAISLGIALVTGFWSVLPLGLYLGLCLQIGGSPAYNLAAIIGPYRAHFQFGGSQRQGNLWGMLAWFTSAPLVLALIVLPYVLWKPGLLFTLPLGAVYSLGLYALTLKPLARLLQRREHAILKVVASEE